MVANWISGLCAILRRLAALISTLRPASCTVASPSGSHGATPVTLGWPAIQKGGTAPERLSAPEI